MIEKKLQVNQDGTMWRDYLINLWESACEESETESHAGYDNVKELRDRHGNILRLRTGNFCNITPMFLTEYKIGYKEVIISREAYHRCLEKWQQSWDSRLFKRWVNRDSKEYNY